MSEPERGLTESGFLHALDIFQIIINGSEANSKWQEPSDSEILPPRKGRQRHCGRSIVDFLTIPPMERLENKL